METMSKCMDSYKQLYHKSLPLTESETNTTKKEMTESQKDYQKIQNSVSTAERSIHQSISTSKQFTKRYLDLESLDDYILPDNIF